VNVSLNPADAVELAAAMLGAYLVTFVIARYALHKPLGLSALTALAVGAPAVPFACVVVLGYLYGPPLITVPVAPTVLIYRSPVRKLTKPASPNSARLT
jgi:hypothetical protein